MYTNIILKVTNPNDLKAIIQSVEGLTSQTYREIQRLPIGVALISGGTLQMPVMAEIRTRETSHGGRSVKISNEPAPQVKEPVIKTEIPNDIEIETPSIKPEQTSVNKKPKDHTTDKAKNVTRVANRLGWVSTEDPDEAIKILSEEAGKMNENVYKYLESLANLGRKFCLIENPKCMSCPMNDGCNYRRDLAKTSKKKLFRKH